MKLELGCGNAPTSGYVHHDLRKHGPHVDVAFDLEVVPWPLPDASLEQIRALDVFEHLHIMPMQWLAECYRLLAPDGMLTLRVPVWGTPDHLIDPTHVRGFHPLNFDYFIAGRPLHTKYGCFYADFSFRSGTVTVSANDHGITAELVK